MTARWYYDGKCSVLVVQACPREFCKGDFVWCDIQARRTIIIFLLKLAIVG